MLTLSDIPGPALLSSTIEQSTAQNSQPQPFSPPSASPAPQQQGFQPSRSNYDAFAALGSSQPSTKPSTPIPSFPPPKQQQQQHQAPQPSNRAADPFAALVSPSSRSGTPSNHAPKSMSSSLLDLQQSTQPSAQQRAPQSTADDDWNFTSSLPEATPTLPTSNTIAVLNSAELNIEFQAKRTSAQSSDIHIQARFSNNTPQAINDLHFQVAIEKVGFESILRLRCFLSILLTVQ